ncbi:type II secretion system F family protein, partial [Candidatus Dependentiae bacterium]
EKKVGFLKRLFQKKVTVKDKILFTRQLSTLLKSGVPLLQALELMVDQVEGRLKSIVISLKDDIKEGTSFANALKKFPDVFPNIYVQLVRAGEATGNLEIILDRLTNFMEESEAIRKRIKSAMTYPLFQLGVAVIVVGILMTYVVPEMAENLKDTGKGLPWSTEILISISNFFTNYLWFIIFGTIGIIFAFRYWKSTNKGARTWDKIKLRIPLVKFFTKTGAVVQFSQTLGMLTESGVNLSESLDIVCSIIDNRILADTLSKARDKIVKQGKIAQYLKQTGIFPPIAIYLIKTGEESGNLGGMLLTVSKNYGEELSELADSLAGKIGPIMLIVMAFVVGFIVISIAVPMLQQADVAGMGM